MPKASQQGEPHHLIVQDTLPVQQLRDGLAQVGIGLIRVGNGHGVGGIAHDAVHVALHLPVETDLRRGQHIFILIGVQADFFVQAVLKGAAGHDIEMPDRLPGDVPVILIRHFQRRLLPLGAPLLFGGQPLDIRHDPSPHSVFRNSRSGSRS